jgi:hypothetical protein
MRFYHSPGFLFVCLLLLSMNRSRISDNLLLQVQQKVVHWSLDIAG